MMNKNIFTIFCLALAGGLALWGVARGATPLTYDGLRASTTNVWKIGATDGEWASINNTIFMNNGNKTAICTGACQAKSRLDVASGDAYIDTLGYGVILTAPNGTCWRAFANGSTSTAQSVACP